MSYEFPRRIVASYILWSIAYILLLELLDHFVERVISTVAQHVGIFTYQHNSSMSSCFDPVVHQNGNSNQDVCKVCVLFVFLSFGLRQELSSLLRIDIWMYFLGLCFSVLQQIVHELEFFRFFPLAIFFNFQLLDLVMQFLITII